jgi:outer membrane receptor for monomeric catechols
MALIIIRIWIAMPSHCHRRLSTVASLRSIVGTLLGTTLAGTPATYAQTPAAPGDSDTVQLPPVLVQGIEGNGYQARVPALPRLTQPLLDTPQSINIVPKKLIQHQNDLAARDALRNVPGISLGAGSDHTVLLTMAGGGRAPGQCRQLTKAALNPAPGFRSSRL